MGKQGRVVIPVEVRDALDLKPGSVLTFSVSDGEALMSTSLTAARKLQAIFASVPRPSGTYASDELIAERRAEALRELN